MHCRTIEVIYPVDEPSDRLPLGNWVMVGDEEGRFKHPLVINSRATLLFSFPYPLVGDVVLVRDNPRTSEFVSIPSILFEHLTGGTPT